MKTRKRPFAKMVAVVLALAMMMSNVAFAEGESIVEDVVVNTEVIPAGQYPTTVEVTVSDVSKVENLKAEDFTVKGQASAWLTSNLHDFDATIKEVSLDGDVLTLTFGEFPEKYVYVDNYTVSGGDLTFKVTKETKTITPIADEFEQIHEEANGGMDYNLFTPEDTSKAQPIVIVFHGYGDNENLYHNKLAVAWADPANQAERPCYVLAPSFSNFMNTGYRTDLYEKVFAKVQEMVEAGKVDPNRIYVAGKSFGGAAVYEFLEKYPENVAGAIAMCGAANYAGGWLFPQKAEDAAKLVDIPLWIAHATTDPTVGIDSSRNMHKMITEAGGKVVKFTEYSDEEMTAAGVTPEMSNHSMEAVVLEDETYLEWLFAQNNSAVEDVVVNTEVTTTGQYPTTIEVTVSDASLLDGLKAEDFSVNGTALGWWVFTPNPFEAKVSDVSVKDNVLTLTISDFTNKYFYVQTMEVTCAKDAKLNFTKDDISVVNTPVADEFMQVRAAEGGAFDYNLYTPEDTSKAQPLVISFHGFLDDDNLYQNRLAVSWAFEENQAERPCYVIAPMMGGFSYADGEARNAIYEKLNAEVQEMIADGQVDPERIYVVGKSFGGAAVYEYCAKYSDEIAAAIAMCGAADSFKIGEEQIAALVDVPLWIAHATDDNTVNVENSRNMYNNIVAAGGKLVKFTEYSEAEMNAAGVTAQMGYHTMEAVVLEDETYHEWLFSHPVVEELPGEGDDGNTGDDVIGGDAADKDNDKADKEDTSVKTGDTAPVVQLTMIAALSMLLAAVIAFKKRVNK